MRTGKSWGIRNSLKPRFFPGFGKTFGRSSCIPCSSLKLGETSGETWFTTSLSFSTTLCARMPRLTALLHTHNDGLRIGRCLETLYSCDEILIIDHGSDDATTRIAREYGAKIVAARNGASAAEYVQGSNDDWVLCLDPSESLTESLAATLFEWKMAPAAGAFSVHLREETDAGWIENPAAETRLVPARWKSWEGYFPACESAIVLEGELLRFAHP